MLSSRSEGEVLPLLKVLQAAEFNNNKQTSWSAGLAPGKAPKKSATANGFSFSFTPHEGAGADEEPETAEPATASARAGPAAAASKPNTSGPADVECVSDAEIIIMAKLSTAGIPSATWHFNQILMRQPKHMHASTVIFCLPDLYMAATSSCLGGAP